MTHGEAARKCRKDAGLSIVELAKLSGISYAMIWAIEKDERSPSIVTAEALADTLGVSLDEYIGHKIRRGHASKKPGYK